MKETESSNNPELYTNLDLKRNINHPKRKNCKLNVDIKYYSKINLKELIIYEGNEQNLRI